MAKSIRITNIQTINGQVFVSYVYGTPPLGSVATAETSWPSAEVLRDHILDLERIIGEDGLLRMALAFFYIKGDGTTNNLNQVTNKTLNLDATAANPVRIT